MANKLDIYYRQTVLRVFFFFCSSSSSIVFQRAVLREEGCFRGVSRSSSRVVFSRSLVGDCGTSPLPRCQFASYVHSFFCLLLHRFCIPPAEEKVGKRRFVLLLLLLGRTPPHIECGGEERIFCTRRPGIGPELHVNLIKVFFSSVTFVLFLSHVRWSFARQKSSGWYH